MPDDPKKPTNGKNQPEESGAAAPESGGEGGNGKSGNGAGGARAWADMSADISLGAAEAKPKEARPTLSRAPVKALAPVDLEALPIPPASTVVLLRSRDGVPFEVFLVQRHSKSEFFANAYVYPGGRVESGDVDADLVRYARALEPEEMASRLGMSDESLALGYHIAALREVYEEAGALAATEGDGKEIDFANPNERERYETYREVLVENEVDFSQVVGWEDLQLRVDELVPFAHWVTPKIDSKRYDAWFFLLRAPSGQDLRHDARETTASFWKSPAQILSDYEVGGLQLAPPTLMTLRDLARFHSLDEALTHYRGREIPTIQPHPTTDAKGRIVLLLPGDADYPGEFAGAVEGPTRLVLDEGRWWVIERGEDEPLH